MQGLISQPIQAAKEELALQKMGGFLRIRGHWDVSRRSGNPDVGNWHGWHLGLSGRLLGSPVAGFLQQEPACSTPAPVGGALKMAMSEAEVSVSRDIPHRRCSVVPLLLCVGGRSFWGTPCCEGSGGVEQAPHPGTGSDTQHISLGPIPALSVRLILGLWPGRFGRCRERRQSWDPG